ncbi:MFS transporter [Sulfurisphaera ohwakuensis]|uniref:MFS family permease n=1 Tax=Sulfurisphaera ohwakuensis TaxID=69656 RepID=A0A650CFQ6_SULOH|nr:MFS transporter [Sulfurisphaera ohwakuensis]MBB5255032.1 MFS family permease [Sulfurisphaera ohwakuensis]QGR16578.1 MFS transporter [Sulfurisphaera ohwakuensis]
MLSKRQLALLSLGTSLSFWDIFNVPYIENFASKNLGEVSSVLILSAEMIGYFIGGVLNGFFATKFGRKPGLLLSMFLIALGSLIGFFSFSPIQLVIAELIIGIGIEGEVAIVPSYVSEMVSKDFRGRAVGLTSMFGFLMSLVVGPMAVFLGEKYWRLLFLPSIVIAFLALIFRFKLPESKMWIERKYEKLKWDKMVIIFVLIWFTSYFTGYSLFSTPIFYTITSKGFENSNLYFTYILYGDPIGVVFASILNDYFERKYFSALANLLSGGLVIVWPFFTGLPFLIIGFLIMFFQGFKFPVMYAYTSENFATKIRTIGYGIADGIGHLGGAVGPIVMALLYLENVSVSYTIVGIMSVISALFILYFGVITKGKSLEEIKG